MRILKNMEGSMGDVEETLPLEVETDEQGRIRFSSESMILNCEVLEIIATKTGRY